MTQLLSHSDLQRLVSDHMDRYITAGARSTVWPDPGRDLALADGDAPAGCLIFSCRTDPSMSNPMGMVHGGVTAALADTCMGIVCSAQCGAPTPTISMTVNYARPVPLEAEIQVRVHTVRMGATSGQLWAEIFLARCPQDVLATATGIYSVKRPC